MHRADWTAGLLDVIMGYDCNLACDYCTITPAMRARALTAAAIDRELRAGRAEGYAKVSFTGGEPTIRAELVPIRIAPELLAGATPLPVTTEPPPRSSSSERLLTIGTKARL